MSSELKWVYGEITPGNISHHHLLYGHLCSGNSHLLHTSVAPLLVLTCQWKWKNIYMDAPSPTYHNQLDPTITAH